MNEEVTIKNRIIQSFKTIDGTPGTYNNIVRSDYVTEKWIPIDSVPGFPFICFSLIDLPQQADWDQASYTGTIVFDTLGYTRSKDSKKDDCLDLALKLQQDMRAALMKDPSLNESGYNMRISSQCGTLAPFGIVAMRITVDFNITY